MHRKLSSAKSLEKNDLLKSRIVYERVIKFLLQSDVQKIPEKKQNLKKKNIK